MGVTVVARNAAAAAPRLAPGTETGGRGPRNACGREALMERAGTGDARAVGWRGTSVRGSTVPLLVLVISVILFSMGLVALRITTNDIRASGYAKYAVEALYLADAGLAHAQAVLRPRLLGAVLAKVDSTRPRDERIAQMGSDTALRVFTDSIAFGGGRYWVKLFDNNDGDGDPRADADNRIYIHSVGMLPSGSQQTVEAVLAKMSAPSVTFEGAVVACANVQTLGNLTIDGRDHDIDGNLLGSGTKGVSTAGTFSRGGNSKIGGTDDGGGDHAPSKNAGVVALVTEQGQTCPAPGGSPDEALGLADGTLKALAQTGAGGSQHVTNPSDLTMPLTGVTYVELACGETWQSMDFGNSTGIVVVHSPCTDAVIKNLNGGTLKGILIADDIVHVHNTVIGGIIQTSSSPSSGNCIGNGTGSILYSGIAISNALASLTNQVFLVAWRQM